MRASGQQRDTSRDGLRNTVERALLSGFQPFWAVVNKTPWLARFANRLIVNNAVLKVPCRPLALSTQASYTNWAALTDRTWFSRYLPPAPQDRLPPVAEVASLFKLRPDRPPVLSDRSTLLFPSFAQWFTDGFLMTDADRRRTRTNHQLDLSQLYGLDSTVTAVLRRRSELPGEKGKLKSVSSGKGEWAPPLYDAAGARDPTFALVPEPTHLPSDWPLEKRAALFAFGGERANSTAFTAAINTLFLREHNRICTDLERNNPGWMMSAFQTAQYQHRSAHQIGGRGIRQPHIAQLDEAAGRPDARLHGEMEPGELDTGRVQPALPLAQPRADKRNVGGGVRRLGWVALRQSNASAGWARDRLCGSQPNPRLADRTVQHGADAGRGGSGVDSAGSGQPPGQLQRLSGAVQISEGNPV
jgi:hypothetical protein